MEALRRVIRVHEERCVSCHRCIAVCPVKMCNDGSGAVVHVDSDLCLGCGACIAACPHGAREGIDDFPEFLRDLRAGIEMVAILAPAATCSFDGNYNRLMGYLRSLGVKAFFDVSFGAELTIHSYIDHYRKAAPKCLIAQPCPALVTYIELYRPELLPYLAPADSPMVHTMKMIREYYPEYRHHKLAVLSPCYAKKREFEAVGLGDYNVTFRSLERHLEEQSIDLNSFTAECFQGPPAERAVLFSSPGGLLRTLEREVPNAWSIGRKIEGASVYEYLNQLAQMLEVGKQPSHVLIDCLNCEFGCNGGAGTRNQEKPLPYLESLVEQRASVNSTKSPRKIRGAVRKFWKPNLYTRAYVDRSSWVKTKFKKPDRAAIEEIHRKTHKTSSADFLNCGSCGYAACEQMAIAIFNKKNKPENCRLYMEKEIRALHDSYRAGIDRAIQDFSQSSIEALKKCLDPLEKLQTVSNSLQQFTAESSKSITAMVENFQKIFVTVDETIQASNQLVQASKQNERNIEEISNCIHQINQRSLTIMQASGVIEEISQKTNLLGINAAIEAAHVGSYGRGFAVVAGEIKGLADNVANQAVAISRNLNDVLGLIERTSQESRKTNASFRNVQEKIQEMISRQEAIQSVVFEQNAGSHQILERIETIKHYIDTILEVCAHIESMNRHLIERISELARDRIRLEGGGLTKKDPLSVVS